ncbi:MAG: potassium channel protein [Proteobacteria bacterium]|nr:potassium channel protein [Pseudomonadota bacterium]
MIFRMLVLISPLFGVMLVGTLGYSLIEGWNWFDSLYMTVISLTTVGYGETHPLSTEGKVFTVLLILTGIGNVAYVIQRLSLEFFHPFFEGIIKERKMDQYFKKISNHYIICGFGRIGMDVCLSLVKSGTSVVVIDRLPPVKEGLTDIKIPYLMGDASHDEILLKAGIKRAQGLVASVKSEAENVFITLSARELNSDLFIISRFEDETTKTKLLSAGADRVINPYQIGGQKISQIILKPTINKILDKVSKVGKFKLDFEEMELFEGNTLIGKTLHQWGIKNKYNVIIIAIEKKDGQIVTNPKINYLFELGDIIVMMANESEFVEILKEYGELK